MERYPDQSVRDLGSTRLAVRRDLVFVPQIESSQPYYLLEDPLNSRFFRLGQAEYTLVSLLDGQTTLHDALGRLSQVIPDHSLTESDVAALARWLVEMDLAQTEASGHAATLTERASQAAGRQTAARVNPLLIRLPLGRPDGCFAALARWIGWLFAPPAVVGWLGVVLLGAYQVSSQWERFAASSEGIFAPGNWAWLFGCWIVLKVLHEASHGVVCKRYGGAVRETGLLLILFAPVAYVDVTSSWRFASRWQRIQVAAAGMYGELLIAALAALVWSSTKSPWLGHLCFNVIAMASVTTLLFNANPLMKFDGYFMLSDALGMPNLYVNGQAYVRAWFRRWVLNVPGALPAWTGRQRILIAVYGWASLSWRICVCVSLTLAAATMFQGAGIVLAALAAVLWFGLPALRFAGYLIRGRGAEQPDRLRLLLVTGTAGGLFAVLLLLVPWPGARVAPAIVEYAPLNVVRADSAGFVQKILVEEGQQVEAGQVLLELRNDELVQDLADLDLQVRQSEIRGRQHEQQRKLAALQAEAKKQESLIQQREELQTQVERLTVRAPSAGQVIRRNLATLLGTYIEQGDEILSLGDDSRKELRVSVAQDDLDAFRFSSICIQVPHESSWQGRLEKIVPRATLSLPHLALGAVHGGSLPVKRVDEKELQESSYELLAPRFVAHLPLDTAQSNLLKSGQRVEASCRAFDESIGEHLYRAASGWIRERISQ